MCTICHSIPGEGTFIALFHPLYHHISCLSLLYAIKERQNAQILRNSLNREKVKLKVLNTGTKHPLQSKNICLDFQKPISFELWGAVHRRLSMHKWWNLKPTKFTHIYKNTLATPIIYTEAGDPLRFNSLTQHNNPLPSFTRTRGRWNKRLILRGETERGDGTNKEQTALKEREEKQIVWRWGLQIG